uniref:Uncharacterized protein n=1 Tax=viral metagenome TaxID=1070528 RepID=A0A6C0HV33_9ZZZZ
MNILAQDNIVYGCGRPSEYENIISQPDQGIRGFIPSIAKYVWQLCIFVGILFLIHQIYEYLKKSFTTPIKTNLVQLYQNKYNEIAEQYTRDKKSHTSKVTDPSLLLLLRNSSKSEEKFDSEQGKDLPEELSSTQKEYLSRELLDMIQKSI